MTSPDILAVLSGRGVLTSPTPGRADFLPVLAGRGALTATAYNAVRAHLSGQGVSTVTDYATRFTFAAAVSGQGVLTGTVPEPLKVTFFPVTGFFSAVAGEPVVQPVSAIVTFTPRLDVGQLIYVDMDDAVVTLRPLTALLWNGVLSGTDHTPGFQLVANIPEFNLDANNGVDSSDGEGNLIYDVSFSVVTFNDANQTLAPFAFIAPTDDTPVCLTDTNFKVLPWQPPSQVQWTPATPASLPLLSVVGGRNCRPRQHRTHHQWAG